MKYFVFFCISGISFLTSAGEITELKKKLYALTPQKLLFEKLSPEEQHLIKNWYQKNKTNGYSNHFMNILGFHLKDIFSKDDLLKPIDEEYNTIFHRAMQEGNETICFMLILSWPDGMKIKNKNQETPLDILQNLIQHCSDKIKKNDYQTILEATNHALDAYYKKNES